MDHGLWIEGRWGPPAGVRRGWGKDKASQLGIFPVRHRERRSEGRPERGRGPHGGWPGERRELDGS